MALHPVGPRPAPVYWRRRVVLLAVIAAAVLLLRALLTGGDEPRKSAGSTPTPTSSVTTRPSPTPTRSPAPTGPVTCTDAMLRLAVTTDARSYPEGTGPKLTVRVSNTSGTPCRRDLGTKQVELLVYSGADRIWSSHDCGEDEGRSVQTIGARSYLESVQTWPGTRSRPGCAGERPAARPGTYFVKLRVGTLRVSGGVFQIRAT